MGKVKTRKVSPAPEGEAGFTVEGLPGTYDVITADRLQHMDDDGNFRVPETKGKGMSKADKESAAKSDED